MIARLGRRRRRRRRRLFFGKVGSSFSNENFADLLEEEETSILVSPTDAAAKTDARCTEETTAISLSLSFSLSLSLSVSRAFSERKKQTRV